MPNPDGSQTEEEKRRAEEYRKLGVLTEEEYKALRARRQKFADDYNAGLVGRTNNVAADQNTADVIADNANVERWKQIEAAKKAAADYGMQGRGGLSAYKDEKGNIVYQGGGLPGLANALQDPNSAASLAYEWGGRQGGAQADVDRARGLAGRVDGRAPVQADMANSMQSRGSQLDALGMYRSAALGQGPSAAQAQFQQGLDRSMQGNMAMANSARGGSLALAQGRLSAMTNNSGMLASSAAQAAQLRAQEQQAGMAGYAGLGSSIRTQDTGEAMGNANLALGSRNANDARAMGYEQLANQTNAQQLAAQQGRIQGLLGANGITVGAQTANANLQAQNQANSESNTRNWIATGAGVVGAGAALLPLFLGGGSTKSGGSGETGAGSGGSDTVWDRGTSDQTGAGGDAWRVGEGTVGVNSAQVNLGGLPASGRPPAPKPAPAPAPEPGLAGRPVSQRLGTAAKRYW
jgi:hypothetical protein